MYFDYRDRKPLKIFPVKWWFFSEWIRAFRLAKEFNHSWTHRHPKIRWLYMNDKYLTDAKETVINIVTYDSPSKA